VLLVAIFHVSFDAAINQLSGDVIPGSNTLLFLIFSGVIILCGCQPATGTRRRLTGLTAGAVGTTPSIGQVCNRLRLPLGKPCMSCLTQLKRADAQPLPVGKRPTPSMPGWRLPFMRDYSAFAAVRRHPEVIARPITLNALSQRFRGKPPSSAKALLITMGPFLPDKDGLPFVNSFGLTAANAVELTRMFRDEVIEAATPRIVRRYTSLLSDLSFEVPVPFFPDPTVGLPDFVIGQVGLRVTAELAAGIVDLGIDPRTGGYGRCGGMAFAGYDFYQQSWSVLNFGSTPPTEGELGDYIFARLIDSLELNARKFVEWIVTLHVLPKLNGVADAAFGAAVGGVGGPLGIVLGAFVANQASIFDFGGAGELLSWTKDEWSDLKVRLDERAAWPVGLIYGDTKNPFDQHQVLAIGYTDAGLGTGTLDIWNNNDLQQTDTLAIDFRGSELKVTGFNDNHTIKGFFAEDYRPKKPPANLKS
jgi:hypothetical protein